MLCIYHRHIDFFVQFIHATSVTLAGSISAIASIETDTGCFIIAVGTSHSELHVFAYAFNGELLCYTLL